MLSGSAWTRPRPAAICPSTWPGYHPDVVFGVIWYRLLATREPLDDRLAGEIAGALTGRIDHGERDRVRRQ
jgi:hypothetical protein